jgi:hypothetical protein
MAWTIQSAPYANPPLPIADVADVCEDLKMSLRNSLRVTRPPADRVEEFKALGLALINCAERGEDCSELLSELQRRTGGLSYEWGYFADFGGAESIEEFAERAALGQAPHVPDIEVAELVEVVGLVCQGAGDCVSSYYLDLFSRNVSHPAPSALIYHSHNYWPNGYEPSAAEIVEKATSPTNVIRL